MASLINTFHIMWRFSKRFFTLTSHLQSFFSGSAVQRFFREPKVLLSQQGWGTEGWSPALFGDFTSVAHQLHQLHLLINWWVESGVLEQVNHQTVQESDPLLRYRSKCTILICALSHTQYNSKTWCHCFEAETECSSVAFWILWEVIVAPYINLE